MFISGSRGVSPGVVSLGVAGEGNGGIHGKARIQHPGIPLHPAQRFLLSCHRFGGFNEGP